MSNKKRNTGGSRRATRKKIPPGKQDINKRIIKVLSGMRRGSSLRKASREFRISPQTVKKYAGNILIKNQTGRLEAKRVDRVERPLLVPTESGPKEIRVRNSRDASRLGSYWSALHKYYESGDTSELKKFDGQFVTDVSRKKHPLITDLETLNALGSAGAVSFESIYSWSAQ